MGKESTLGKVDLVRVLKLATYSETSTAIENIKLVGVVLDLSFNERSQSSHT